MKKDITAAKLKDFKLTQADAELLIEGLEALAYWQISDDKYRNNGFVYEPGSDDAEAVEMLERIDALSIQLGGEAITFTGPHAEPHFDKGDDEAAPEDGDEEDQPITFHGSDEMLRALKEDQKKLEDMGAFDAPNNKEPTQMNETMCQRSDCYEDPHRITECKHKHDAQPALKACSPDLHAFYYDQGFKACNSCGHAEPFPNNRDGLIRFIAAQCDKMVSTARAKNADYAGVGADPFANFSRVEALGICKVEVGFLTRMTDKLCRINSFVQAGTLQVKDESVQDTLRDLANYSLLFLAYIESKKAGAL